MSNIIERIKEDVQKRLIENKTDRFEQLLYVDHKIFEKGEALDLTLKKVKIKQPTYVVFVDEAPGMNWAHPCHYLLYDAEKGELIERIDADFPYFMGKRPKTLELFRSSSIVEAYKRKKPIRVPLEPAKLSSWQKFAKLPLFLGPGHKYAIFYSGGSNCRHVNDMEFLYRTLVDIYGFQAEDIYVLNYNGSLDWDPETWEPAAPCDYPVDGTPFRMNVFGEGNRNGFQDAISDLATKIGPKDCLFIHTNNHGGWDGAQNQGLMSGWGGAYYADDFASDLAALPKIRSLLVMMEPCHAGAFNSPIMLNSPADRTVVQAAVPWNEGSAGGWPFDPWAEMWISAMAGVRGDGSPLVVSPDDDLNSRISAYEAFDYALAIDNPVMDESSPDLSKSLYLGRCGLTIKPVKEFKEPKEFKEFKEPKEFKEFKEPKEFKDFKEFKEYEIPEKYFEVPGKYYEVPGFTQRPEPFSQPVASDVEARISRLESLVEQLSPFIGSSLRPELRNAAYKAETKKKK